MSKQKFCNKCGNKYVGGSNSKYCFDCKDKIRLARQRELKKRRYHEKLSKLN